MIVKTTNCQNRAEELVERGDEVNLRYACLELRMAIEYLFYELISLYEDEWPTYLFTASSI